MAENRPWREDDIRVEVDLSEGTLAVIRQMAEERDTTVEELLQDMVERSLKAGGPKALGESADEITEMDGVAAEAAEIRRREASGPSIYQIKVTLRGSEPPIWRRFQVRGDITLAGLHDVLQAVMGWWDYHLHQFMVGETYYGVPHPEYMIDMVDETEVQLNEIADDGSAFVYEYDFGDGWLHVLEVEKILAREPGQQVPICIGGERATPPEDVGGIWGYEQYLEAMADPDHPEHEMYWEWRGDFDPEAFNLKEINAALRDL